MKAASVERKLRRRLASARRGRAPGELSTDAERLLKAQAGEREWKEKLAEIQYRVERGELVPLAEIKERDIRKVHAVRRGLLALPKAIASLVVGLSPQEAEAIIDRKVRDLLHRFASM